ncbi:MAG: hypothetical protein ACLRFE_03345, partial [Clostridia bacterium]
MADITNLERFLKDVAGAIKTKKGTTALIPAAKFDEEIASITAGEGAVENGDVKLFASVEEMNNYVEANSGDLAIVYSVEATSVASGTKFSNLYFPKTMSVPKRTLTQPTVTATGDADITVVFTSTSVTFSIKYPKCPYTFTVLYELSEGTTYVRNDTYSDSPFNAAELNEYGFIWSNELLIFPASVSVTFTMPTLASNAVKAAFRYGELIFGGMYQYKSSKWTIADNQFSVKENDVISGKTAYGPDGLITGTRPVVAMELVENVKYEPMTNYVGVTIDRDVAINTGGILTIKGAVVADKVGLTGDKIVAGNTILGVKGTASAGGSTELGEYSATFISDKPFEDGSNVKVLYTNDENKLDTIPKPAPFSGRFDGYNDITTSSWGSFVNITTSTIFTTNKVYRASNTLG